MKGPILDWLAVGEALVPLLHRRDKSLRGFNHPRTGALLCPAGLDWNAQGYPPCSTLIYNKTLIFAKYPGKITEWGAARTRRPMALLSLRDL